LNVEAVFALVSRYRGDVREPRGGVRWIIPEKAAYWR